jgi:septum formation protein
MKIGSTQVPRIVLASNSPSRRLALDLLGLSYEVVSAGIDEKAIRHSDPLRLTRELSETKAMAVADRLAGTSVVIAGDAVAVLGSRILEKPSDLEEAFDMLSALSGSTFSFVTGLAVYHTGTKRMLSTVQRSDITFRRLLETEIRGYMDSHPVLNCAGAYDEDAVLLFAERVEGNPNFRTALPVGDLMLFLRQHGIAV